ncbi:MAG: oligopeptide/dipeptide ABC transporter ATP-binding protein [Candidatus Flemingiibacterium sp.]
MSEIIVKASDLCVDFDIRSRAFGKPDRLSAVRNANFEIRRGETFGLVGESGCGKSTLAGALAHFVPISSGELELNGVRLTKNSPKADWNKARHGVQMIFQDPFGSLNPRFQVWQLISEPMLLAGEDDEKLLYERAVELLGLVGLSEKDAGRNIFEFSGGQRQRIAIARALSVNPEFIICDEPTSALDVSVHSQICNLLLDLQEKYSLTYLFITHNLALVRHLTDRMAVLYMGQIVETGSTDEIFGSYAKDGGISLHPYTRALLSAIPEVYPTPGRERIILEGEVSSPINAGDSCRFAPRCRYCREECKSAPIAGREIGKDHVTCCPYFG